MINKLYLFLRQITTNKEERGNYSAGRWQNAVRVTAGSMARNSTAKIIELGCGEGLFLKLLAEQNPGANITGIDKSEELLGQAGRRLEGFNNILLTKGNALHTGIAESGFDKCFCLNTVYNMNSKEDVNILFSEAYRLLKTGGKFIFDIRNAGNPLVLIKYGFSKLCDTQINVPLRAYAQREIESMLGSKGFAVIEKKYPLFPKNDFSPILVYVAEKK